MRECVCGGVSSGPRTGSPQTGRGAQLAAIDMTDADHSLADRQRVAAAPHLCKLYEVLCTVCKGWQVGWAGDGCVDGDVDLGQLDLRFLVGGERKCWCLLMEGWVKMGGGAGVGDTTLLLDPDTFQYMTWGRNMYTCHIVPMHPPTHTCGM